MSDWGKARGLQIEGAVTELDGEEEDAAGRLFQEKFPHLGDAAMHTHYWKLAATTSATSTTTRAATSASNT